ncbi:MAG: hypothetical protein ACKOYP_00260, partial [Bacteroidota bacterium]
MDQPVLPVLTTSFVGSTNCVSPIQIGGTPFPGNGSASASVTGTGDFVFSWTNIGAAAPVNTTSTSEVKNLLGADTKTISVEVTNRVNGCKSSGNLIVPDLSKVPAVSVNTSPNNICDPAFATSQFTGSVEAVIGNINLATTYSYAWTRNAAAEGTTAKLIEREDGTYTVVVTQTETGCVSVPVSGVILNEKILPGITTAFTPSTNCIPLTIDGKLRDGNGVITPTITQATTFTSIWHNADTPTSPIDPLANETANQPVLKYVTGGPTAFYTLEIINDENGCRNTATVLLPDGKARPVITLAKSDNDICDPSLATNAPGVDFSGAITLTITPPVNPDPLAYNYAWSSAADPTFAKTTKDLVGLPSALYTVEVTDIETGCTSVPVSAQVLDKTTLPSLSSSSA